MNSLGDWFGDSAKKQLGYENQIDYTYISTEKDLLAASKIWKTSSRLAIDTEFDDNHNYYGRHLCLIQLYDQKKVYLIDTIALENKLQAIIDIFEDEKIEKLFHSASSDLIVLDDLYGCKMKNIHDTSLMHRFLFVSNNDIGLQTLLRENLDIELEKEAQISDWSIRPLSKKQIKYAITDVFYLFELFEKLQNELQKLDKWAWYEEERQKLEEIKAEKEAFPAIKASAKYKLNPQQIASFANLYELREQIAAKYNRPTYKVISNKRLVELVENPPQKLADWQDLKGVSRYIKSKAPSFHQAIKDSENLPEDNPILEELRRRQEEKDYFFQRKQQHSSLLHQRDSIFQQLRQVLTDVDGQNLQSMILTNKLKNRILWKGLRPFMNNWKMEVLEKVAQSKKINISLLLDGIPESE